MLNPQIMIDKKTTNGTLELSVKCEISAMMIAIMNKINEETIKNRSFIVISYG